ncbi:glycosyltransferase family 2 protein [Pseudoduganella sp. LjRoot289]|uniref:glycosyltransferase family 2 protein n=1 Tax=Pseudoduganella sp. LjRoot289 TaxID=3342314 RepID=UPI003ED07791
MKITVVVPAYNAAAFIGTALASLRAQTHRNWEALVVDDCSSDDTRAVVRQWTEEDDRIRLLELPQNGGPAAARNAGFDAAQGEWIALLDADDAWEAERLARFLPHLSPGKLDLVWDRLALYNAAQEKVVAHSWPWVRQPRTIGPLQLLLWDLPGQRAPLGWAKPLLRRAWLNEHRLRYLPALRAGEDWRLLMDAVMAGARTQVLPFAAYRYTLRLEEKNFSQTKVDFSGPQRLNSAVRLEYGPRWPLATRAAAVLRGWLIGGLAAKARLKPAVRGKRWGDLAKLLLTSPRCWAIVLLNQFEKAIWYR